VTVIDERTLVYPEYRGNGVMASLGNIAENGHIGLLFIDFCGDAIGLHVNGRAAIVENEELLSREQVPAGVLDALLEDGGRKPERWVGVEVVEAYIHCSKHIPRYAELAAEDAAAVRRARTTDYFGAAARCRRESEEAAS
jgi:hypothetical protein